MERLCKWCNTPLPETMRADANFCNASHRTSYHKALKKGRKPIATDNKSQSTAIQKQSTPIQNNVSPLLIDKLHRLMDRVEALEELVKTLQATREHQAEVKPARKVDENDKWITIAEVMERYSVSRSYLGSLDREGILRKWKISNKVYYREDELGVLLKPKEPFIQLGS